MAFLLVSFISNSLVFSFGKVFSACMKCGSSLNGDKVVQCY